MTEDDDDKYTEAHARDSDPETSHEAAHKIMYTNMEDKVYRVICETGVPVTCLCISRYGHIDPWSVSPRLRPLERKGAIERYGHRVVRNSNGNLARLTAWRVKKSAK